MSTARSLMLALPFMPLIILFMALPACVIISKLNCHNQKWNVAFFSKTGTLPPESITFTFTFSMASMFGFSTLLTNWGFTNFLTKRAGPLNNCTLIAGTLSFLGFCLLGSSTVLDSLPVHDVAGIMIGLFGYVYTVLATLMDRMYLSCCKSPKYKTENRISVPTSSEAGLARKGAIVKLFCLVIVSLSMVTFVSCLVTRRLMEKRLGKEKTDKELGIVGEWQNEDGSCKLINHKLPRAMSDVNDIGAIAQYVSLTCLLVVVATNYTSMKRICNLLTGEDAVGDEAPLCSPNKK